MLVSRYRWNAIANVQWRNKRNVWIRKAPPSLDHFQLITIAGPLSFIMQPNMLRSAPRFSYETVLDAHLTKRPMTRNYAPRWPSFVVYGTYRKIEFLSSRACLKIFIVARNSDPTKSYVKIESLCATRNCVHLVSRTRVRHFERSMIRGGAWNWALF